MEEAIQDALARQMVYQQNQDKSFIDKLTAKVDVERMRELHRTLKIKRTEVMEMLQLMAGNESKFLNFDEFERALFAKWFIKISESFQIDDAFWDLYEKIVERTKNPAVLHVWGENIDWVNRSTKAFVNNFQFLTRSGMSVNAVGFDKVLKSKFEVDYRTTIAPQKKQGILSSFLKGGN